MMEVELGAAPPLKYIFLNHQSEETEDDEDVSFSI